MGESFCCGDHGLAMGIRADTNRIRRVRGLQHLGMVCEVIAWEIRGTVERL
jgi:hypothetical protein